MNRDRVLDIKKKLKRTWSVFFTKFGKLLPIQIKSIPIILEGRNLVITSSTASGKTEAVLIPLIERMLEEKWSGLSILYITPTRALVNDIYHRFKESVLDCRIKLSVKTGDRPQFKPGKPSDILITTPESVDSLLCRHFSVFKTLRAIIIDEIHLIDNTYRGDQLRLLLRRVLSGSQITPNIYLLSATIPDCVEMGDRYISEYEIVKLKGQREIKYTLIESIEEIFKYLRPEKLRKILIFCNRRQSVEEITVILKRLKTPYTIVAHHGNLGRAVREEAETFMKTSKIGICIATMTLEIGIDIGDVDAVVLAEIPWSVSALLQRTGRSNRRSDTIRAFAIYKNKKHKKLLTEQFSLAKKGILQSNKYTFDLSVLIQQIFSCLFGNRKGITESYFLNLFEGFCTRNELIDILIHLESLGFILNKSDKWYATTKLMDIGELGFIHSNIPDVSSYSVIDGETQNHIGNVLYPVDNIFILAGRIWKIIKIEAEKIIVKNVKSAAYLPEFEIKNSIGKYFYYLPEYLRKQLISS